MKITILCVGKIKERYWKDAIAEYTKRLSRYVKLDIMEVSDEKTPEGASAAVEEQIREKEGERLLRVLREDSYVITLEILGKKVSSEQFSEKLEQLGISGESHVTFLIGGSLGLAESVRKKADYRLSFSDMTFPHQMMRVILLEQIYRGFRIMNHEPYHK
ncbi:MAG: 23S rRNA (pseudouridine(1915)-N(3))-methyltransferase RlmH [Lachnospiraceae bacterium]|nr:23S rRNA (pseudouridine(1915)-N(3))-methyltransferase RlmH [Lachnospiraceae bacterium]